MKIGGHGIRQHIRFLAPLFGLITAVWLLRMVLYAASSPHGIFRVVSVTLATAVAVLLSAVMIHHRDFGSYPSVVASAFLLVTWEQLLVSAAIAFAAFTGLQNIYSIPEYSFGESHLAHIAGHLTAGVGSGTLIGSAVGCLLLMLLRLLVPAVHGGPSLHPASPASRRKG